MGEVAKSEPAPAIAVPVISASSSSSATSKMGKLIDDLTGGAPLGETDAGKAWCLKALHPADTNVLTAPMPANETRQFSSVQYLQMDVMTCPAAFNPALAWDVELYVLRDPVLLFAYRARQAGASDVVGYIFSKQYGANDYLNSYVNIRDQVEKFRITSHSLTAYFDGASTSDQGHIVAAQTEYPRMHTPGYLPGLTGELQGILPFTYYQDALPTYENIVQTSRAFQGPASGGVYCPSKLQSLGTWTTTNDTEVMLGSSYGVGGAGQFNALGRSLSWGENPVSTFCATFPYLTMVPADGFQRIYKQVDSSLTTIFFKGIASTSTLRITTRWTMDVMARPGSSYAPYVRMPPVEDRMAFKMYSEVSRRLPDAFPGSHNALGAILPIIGKIASAVLPSLIPTIQGWLGDKRADRAEQEAAGWNYTPSFMERFAGNFFDGAGTQDEMRSRAMQSVMSVIGPRRRLGIIRRAAVPVAAAAAAPAPRFARRLRVAIPPAPGAAAGYPSMGYKRSRAQKTGRVYRRKYT